MEGGRYNYEIMVIWPSGPRASFEQFKKLEPLKEVLSSQHFGTVA